MRDAVRPVANPDPTRPMVARTPPRGRRLSVTERTAKLSEPTVTPEKVSVKSGPPVDHRRPPPRVSSSSTVLNGERDQLRSATELPSVT